MIHIVHNLNHPSYVFFPFIQHVSTMRPLMLSYQVLITFQASRYITLNMSSQFGSIVLGTHLVCRNSRYPFVEWSLIMFRVCPFCCGSTRQLMRYHMHRPRNIFTRWLAHSRGSILSIVMFCFVDCIVYHAHHICAHYPR